MGNLVKQEKLRPHRNCVTRGAHAMNQSINPQDNKRGGQSLFADIENWKRVTSSHISLSLCPKLLFVFNQMKNTMHVQSFNFSLFHNSISNETVYIFCCHVATCLFLPLNLFTVTRINFFRNLERKYLNEQREAGTSIV